MPLRRWAAGQQRQNVHAAQIPAAVIIDGAAHRHRHVPRTG